MGGTAAKYGLGKTVPRGGPGMTIMVDARRRVCGTVHDLQPSQQVHSQVSGVCRTTRLIVYYLQLISGFGQPKHGVEEVLSLPVIKPTDSDN